MSTTHGGLCGAYRTHANSIFAGQAFMQLVREAGHAFSEAVAGLLARSVTDDNTPLNRMISLRFISSLLDGKAIRLQATSPRPVVQGIELMAIIPATHDT